MDKEQEGGAPEVTPEVSPDAAGNSSVDLAALEATLDKLLDQKLKARQSEKDKRFAKQEGETREIKTEIDQLKDRLARMDQLTAAGLTRDQALTQMEGEELLANLRAQANQRAAPLPAGNELETFLQEIGLDPNLPEVLEVLRSEQSPLKQASKLTMLAEKRKAEKPIAGVTPAQVISGNASKGAPTRDLSTEYQTEVSKIRRGDAQAQWTIIQKYRKIAKDLGVEPPA